MGANQVIYLDNEDLTEAIETKDICMACIDGNYPTSTEDAEEFCSRRNELRSSL